MPTKEELYERASELEIEGRSDMNKAELERAIAEAEGNDGGDDTRRGPGSEEVADEPAKGPQTEDNAPIADGPQTADVPDADADLVFEHESEEFLPSGPNEHPDPIGDGVERTGHVQGTALEGWSAQKALRKLGQPVDDDTPRAGVLKAGERTQAAKAAKADS